jgi:hypothetical protein
MRLAGKRTFVGELSAPGRVENTSTTFSDDGGDQVNFKQVNSARLHRLATELTRRMKYEREDTVVLIARFLTETLGPGPKLDAELRHLAELLVWNPDSDQAPPAFGQSRIGVVSGAIN